MPSGPVQCTRILPHWASRMSRQCAEALARAAHHGPRGRQQPRNAVLSSPISDGSGYPTGPRRTDTGGERTWPATRTTASDHPHGRRTGRGLEVVGVPGAPRLAERQRGQAPCGRSRRSMSWATGPTRSPGTDRATHEHGRRAAQRSAQPVVRRLPGRLTRCCTRRACAPCWPTADWTAAPTTRCCRGSWNCGSTGWCCWAAWRRRPSSWRPPPGCRRWSQPAGTSRCRAWTWWPMTTGTAPNWRWTT